MKLDVVDPYVIDAIYLDSLSITQILTPSALPLQSSGWADLADAWAVKVKSHMLMMSAVFIGPYFGYQSVSKVNHDGQLCNRMDHIIDIRLLHLTSN